MLTAAFGDPQNRAGGPPPMPYLTWGPRVADHPNGLCLVWNTPTLRSLEIDQAKTRGQALKSMPKSLYFVQVFLKGLPWLFLLLPRPGGSGKKS